MAATSYGLPSPHVYIFITIVDIAASDTPVENTNENYETKVCVTDLLYGVELDRRANDIRHTYIIIIYIEIHIYIRQT